MTYTDATAKEGGVTRRPARTFRCPTCDHTVTVYARGHVVITCPHPHRAVQRVATMKEEDE